ncbi:hypothetical protein [Gordonia phthalatica]|uniref:PIN domain-containing protein n=1 Tax=Gordonia phthalatica TaxID=1136941 RepID=A0A0N9NAI9_9ACTN|nr:hypothetical protein ACH46_13800 [Gordonia phthalatica]
MALPGLSSAAWERSEQAVHRDDREFCWDTDVLVDSHPARRSCDRNFYADAISSAASTGLCASRSLPMLAARIPIRAAVAAARVTAVPIGVADAANIVLADVYRTRLIATLDRKHFEILRLRDGTAPTLLP